MIKAFGSRTSLATRIASALRRSDPHRATGRMKRAAGPLGPTARSCRAAPGVSHPLPYIELLAVTIANGFVPLTWTTQSVFAIAKCLTPAGM